jgi:Flp pilus assembly protein TadB
MMIVGFGMLGMFLRRRRSRSIERQPVQLPEAATATLQRS